MDIVVSGMRPTGRLHIGHYFGAIRNWVKLQEQYDCYFFIADWHALTTHFEDTSHIKENSREMVLDWLASGINIEKSVIFIQSLNPCHSELFLLLSMITPISWLERCPTYKEIKQDLDLFRGKIFNVFRKRDLLYFCLLLRNLSTNAVL